jgi:hypothetical protein
MSSQTHRTGFVALVLLGGMQAAEAKQCNAEMPSNPQGHWSYRLIDGRKCWYQGENNFAKSLLQWPEQSSALSAFGRADPNPKEKLLPLRSPSESQPAEPGNQSDPQTFEARWSPLDVR